MFALPAVSAVISYKWDTWARRYLMYELAAYCAWLAAFTAFSLILQVGACTCCPAAGLRSMLPAAGSKGCCYAPIQHPCTVAAQTCRAYALQAPAARLQARC